MPLKKQRAPHPNKRLLPPRERWIQLRTRVGPLITAHSACIGLVFLLVLAGWAAYSWVLTVERIVRYYNPLPVWDYWNVVQHLPRYRAFDARVLWVQHNEHRIVFPEIVFAIDMLLVHGRQVLPLAISFFCYFSTWLVMSWTILSDSSLSRAIRYSAILLAGILIGWQGSAAVLAIPFLLQWTLAQFASVVALALIIPLKKTSRIFYLVGTVACATVATYSSANGLLLWPVILLACVLSCLRGRYIWVVAIAAIIDISLYFVGYHFTHRLDLSTLFSHPVYLLGFLSSYMSMPFGRLKSGHLCVWTGFVNLALFFYLLSITARARLLASAPAIVLFGYFVFTLLTAILTAAGRMNPNDMTFTAAMASRYLTFPLANWGALIIALIWLSGRCGWRLMSPRIIVVTATVLLLLILPKFARWLYGNDVFFAGQQWATLSVENGLFDPEIARNLQPAPAFIKPLVQRLRYDHLSLFYRGYSGLLGQPLTSRFPPPSTRSRLGGVMRIFPVSGGLEIVGWTDWPRPERFVFVNESDQIVGLGRKLPAGSPPNFSQEAPSSLAWVGFINLSFESKSFSTYSFGPHEGRPTPVMDGSSIPVFPREPAKPSSSSATHR